VKEYELLRKNFSETGNFGRLCFVPARGTVCAGWMEQLLTFAVHHRRRLRHQRAH
jgi:hypothetical protein